MTESEVKRLHKEYTIELKKHGKNNHLNLSDLHDLTVHLGYLEKKVEELRNERKTTKGD